MVFVSPAIEDSSLLFIHSLNLQIVTIKFLMNLFCCFGNVDQVLIDTTTTSALVQFEYRPAALEALNSLNQVSFFNSELRIAICPYQRLAFRQEELERRPCVLSLLGNCTYFRFQNSLKIKYNPPTPVLHITSLSERCDPVVLFELISQVNEPKRIVKLTQRSAKGSPMYLAEFTSSEQAIEVLSVLHNKVIDGRSIKVSFSIRG